LAEESHRVMRMMENKLCDSFEGSQMVAGMHGGGSPLMETITMMSRYDLEPLKDIAKYLAGFEGVKLPRYERATATPRAMLEKFEQAKKMKYDEKLEAYNFLMGAINQLLRSFALGHKGMLSKIGLKTFVDPRLEGGKTNRSCSEGFVKVVELEGEEFLYYTAPKPNVAFLRGTTADEYGNITMEEEAIYSLSRVAAMAHTKMAARLSFRSRELSKAAH
jgi:acyl CoA:acetate/3-ketoacid CoA transferase alpha subunit